MVVSVENDLIFGVSDFVGLLNQTLEYAYPSVVVEGELANLRVSKNKWVYFDLKDKYSSVKFFGTVYQLPGPLEDGMVLQVRGMPRLHNQFGFSVTVQNMRPVGEGSLKKAAALLEAKLIKEGLFDESRKRPLPYPPKSVGLITSGESAAYRDFIKILEARWAGINVVLADVQVQGEPAPAQIVAAIEYFNSHVEPVDTLVIVRGGGSADDLAAFSTEQVTRAVAASRIPTLVAIGHEVDVSLAELAADQRASTPSNAAEMLVPDRQHELRVIADMQKNLQRTLSQNIQVAAQQVAELTKLLHGGIERVIERSGEYLARQTTVLAALSPTAALQRGYAVIRTEQGIVVRSGGQVAIGDMLAIQLQDAKITTKVEKVE